MVKGKKKENFDHIHEKYKYINRTKKNCQHNNKVGSFRGGRTGEFIHCQTFPILLDAFWERGSTIDSL